MVFCVKRAVRQPTNGPRLTHSGTRGKSELSVQREPTGRVLIVMVIENRKREGTRDRERKRKRDEQREMSREKDI